LFRSADFAHFYGVLGEVKAASRLAGIRAEQHPLWEPSLDNRNHGCRVMNGAAPNDVSARDARPFAGLCDHG
jgi:hypothetical protein